MKRLIIVLVFILGFATIGMATEVLYRISSGEVYAIVPDGKAMEPPEGFAVVSNPEFIDGTSLKRRAPGQAKIYVDGSVRNATVGEITNFPAFAIADMNQLEENEAKLYFKNHPIQRRVLKALVKEIVDALNVERAEHGRAAIDYQTAFINIINRISKDD